MEVQRPKRPRKRVRPNRKAQDQRIILMWIKRIGIGIMVLLLLGQAYRLVAVYQEKQHIEQQLQELKQRNEELEQEKAKLQDPKASITLFDKVCTEIQSVLLSNVPYIFHNILRYSRISIATRRPKPQGGRLLTASRYILEYWKISENKSLFVLQ